MLYRFQSILMLSFNHVPLSPSSINSYRSNSDDALRLGRLP